MWTNTFPWAFLKTKILITSVLGYAYLILHPLLAHVPRLKMTGDAVSQARCKLTGLSTG